MLRRLALLLTILAAGCAVDQEEPASAVSDLVSGRITDATTLMPSDDGAWVIVARRLSSGTTKVVRVPASGTSERTLAQYPAGDSVEVANVTNGFAQWIVGHADGSWSIAYRSIDLATPAVVVPGAGSIPRRTSDLLVTRDRRWLLVQSTRLFVIPLGTTAPAPTMFDFPGAGFGINLWPAPDAQRVLVVERGNGASFQASYLLDLSASTPVLGARIASTLRPEWVSSGTFDGTTFVSGASDPAGGDVVAAIDVTTGSGRVLTKDVDNTNVLGSRGNLVWYTARRWDRSVSPPKVDYVLERANRDGSGTPVRLASSPTNAGGIRAHLSKDGSSLLYRVGYSGSSPHRLFSVASDGSGPARLVSQGKQIDFISTQANRHLVYVDDGTSRTSRLIDDVTGATLDSWTGYPSTGTQLSADGLAVYQPRGCDVGAVPGVEVVRLSGGGATLVPCQIGGTYGELLRMPGSGAMLYMRTERVNGGEPLASVLFLQP